MSIIKPKILLVPDHIYNEALCFCNDRLKEQNRELITELPAGYRANPNSCPCGTATGLCVGGFVWCKIGAKKGEVNEGGPINFVNYFDDHTESDVLTLPVRESQYKKEFK